MNDRTDRPESNGRPRRSDGNRQSRSGGYRGNQRHDRSNERSERSGRAPQRDGERKPFTNDRREQAGGDRRSFNNERNRSYRNDRPSRDGGSNERGGYRSDRNDQRGERGGYRSDRGPQRDGERRPYGGDRTYGGDRNERSSGERRPFNRDRPTDDRKPFRGDREARGGQRDDRGGYRSDRGGQRDDRGGFRSDRAPQRDGERRPYSGERRSFNSDRPSGDRKPFRGDRDDRGARRDDRGGYRSGRDSQRDERGGYRRDRDSRDSRDPRGRGGTRGGGRSDRGGADREFTEEERLRHSLRPVRSEHDDPIIAEDVQPSDLHPSARNELKTLQPEVQERVSLHLAMVAQLIEDDPELAHQHAISASRRAGRIPVARETLAITAYRIGDYALAIRELRTFRRLSGSDTNIAIMVDSERGLGRPEKAIETALEVDRTKLETTDRVYLAIALSGARLDLGQTQQALFELEIPELNPDKAFPWSPELFSAYAAVLEDLGRTDEAAEWGAHAERAAAALESHFGGLDELNVVEIEEHDHLVRNEETDTDSANSVAGSHEAGDGDSADDRVSADDSTSENDSDSENNSDSKNDIDLAEEPSKE